MSAILETPTLETPAFDLDAFVAAHERKDLLRFITCGSVDDGKSTLLGRLLWETGLVAEDHIAALHTASRRHGTQGSDLDLALLVDGLAAEREQGITIDVAYRFFSTAKRRFIVADTPGHEQYTRNMATGASTADLAILLVDARSGPTPQTRRHALVASMLRVRHVVVAINKMDLVAWSESVADSISVRMRALCDGLGFDSLAVIPLSALSGENVVTQGTSAPWYRGRTLLEHLESVPVLAAEPGPFRLPVQRVNRPDPSFRGVSGTIASGVVRVGDAVRILPAGQSAQVARIVAPSGDVAAAGDGAAVTIVLDRPVDVSRGDVLADPHHPAHVGREMRARLQWFDEAPGRVGARYLLKLGTRSVTAHVTGIAGRVALDTMQIEPASSLAINDIGDVTLSLERSIAYDSYADSRELGGFLLIDPETFDTVALGLVQDAREPMREAPTAMAPTAKALAVTTPAPTEAPMATESTLRSVYKTISWRVVGSIDTTLVAWLLTGSFRASLAIGGVEMFTKSILYFMHERVWLRVRIGQK